MSKIVSQIRKKKERVCKTDREREWASEKKSICKRVCKKTKKI